MITPEHDALILPPKFAEFRHAIATKKLVMVNSASFLFNEQMFRMILCDMEMSVTELTLDSRDTFPGFQEKFAERLPHLYGIRAAGSSIPSLLEGLQETPPAGPRGLMMITCSDDLDFHQELAGFLKELLTMELPLTLYLNGQIPVDLFVGNYLLLDSIAEFGCESFYLSEADVIRLLEMEGFSRQEAENIQGFCGGDLGAVLTFVLEKKQNPYFDSEGTKVRLMQGTKGFLQYNYCEEEISALCHMGIFRIFSLPMLEDFFEDRFDYMGLFRSLREKGIVVSDHQGSYFFLPYVRQLLQEQRMCRRSRPERIGYEKRAVQSLKHEGRIQEAIELSVTVRDRKTALSLGDRLAHKALLKGDIRFLGRIFETLPESVFEDEPFYKCLHLLVSRFDGEINQARGIALNEGHLAIALHEKHPRWSIYFLFFAVMSLIDSVEIAQAEKLLDAYRKEIDSIDDVAERLLDLAQSQIYLLEGKQNLAEQLYFRSARYLEEHFDQMFWNTIVLSFLAQSPFHYLRDSRQIYRSLEDTAKKYMKKEDQIRYVWHKSFALLVRMSFGERMKLCRETEDFLAYLESLGEKNNLCAWALLLGAQYREMQGNGQAAMGYLNEALYQGNRSGNRILTNQTLFKMAQVLRDELHLERAVRTLQDLEENTLFATTPVHRGMLLLEKARLAEHQPENQALELYAEVSDLFRKIGYQAGWVRTSLDRALSMFRNHCPEEDIVGLFREVLKVAKANDCIYLFEQERKRYDRLYHYLAEVGLEDPLLDQFVLRIDPEDGGINVRLFGEFMIRSPRGTILEEDWPTRKVRGLFHYLLIRQDQRIARERLAELFWPDLEDSGQASSNLRVALSLLGKTLKKIGLKDILKRNRQKAWIEMPAGSSVDYHDAMASVSRGRELIVSEQNSLAEKELKQALKILEQPYLETQNKEQWAEEERVRTGKQRDKVLFLLLKISLAENKLTKAEKYCHQLLVYDRLREVVYVTLIGILKSQGRMGEALNTYKTYRRILKEELNIKPSARIVKLAGEMEALDH